MDIFANIEWLALAKIVLLDVILGGDNAVVIAMACASVPLAQRSKAIFWGTATAVAMRIVILVFAAFLIGIPFLKLVAGGMLVWIGYKLLADQGGHEIDNKSDKMWDAIKTIALADLVMSLDNVFAVTAASQSAGEHGLAYAIFGVFLSIPIIIFGATLVSKVIDRFPIIIWAGAALLGWVGGEMVVSDVIVQPLMSTLYKPHTLIPLFFACLVPLLGWYATKIKNDSH